MKRLLPVVLVLAAAVLLSAFSATPSAPPPTCYGPACIPNGWCNFVTWYHVCISTCPCDWSSGKPKGCAARSHR